MTRAAAAILAISALSLSACDKASQVTSDQAKEAEKAAEVTGSKQSVLDALADSSELSTMAKLVKSAGLEKTFEGIGSYTIFAPSDAAFAKLSDEQREQLESADGRPQLIALLRQHVATGYVSTADLDKGIAENGGAASLATMGGAPIRLHKAGGSVLLGPGDSGPKISGPAIISRNGVIYPIDQVIPPQQTDQPAAAE